MKIVITGARQPTVSSLSWADFDFIPWVKVEAALYQEQHLLERNPAVYLMLQQLLSEKTQLPRINTASSKATYRNCQQNRAAHTST